MTTPGQSETLAPRVDLLPGPPRKRALSTGPVDGPHQEAVGKERAASGEMAWGRGFGKMAPCFLFL